MKTGPGAPSHLVLNKFVLHHVSYMCLGSATMLCPVTTTLPWYTSQRDVLHCWCFTNVTTIQLCVHVAFQWRAMASWMVRKFCSKVASVRRSYTYGWLVQAEAPGHHQLTTVLRLN